MKRDWNSLLEHAKTMGKDPTSLTFGHCNFIHITETTNKEKAIEEAHKPFIRVMGTHRTWEHLQECYMAGTIDMHVARIADLVTAGLQYIVLGPVTDDPKQFDLLAKRIMPNFA